jgi:hypothetical protein
VAAAAAAVEAAKVIAILTLILIANKRASVTGTAISVGLAISGDIAGMTSQCNANSIDLDFPGSLNVRRS